MRNIVIFCLLSVLLTGCFSSGKIEAKGSMVKVAENENESTYLVIGAGIITIKQHSDVIVVENNSIGSYYWGEPNKMGFGYDGSLTTYVKKDSERIVEVKKTLFGDIEISTIKGD